MKSASKVIVSVSSDLSSDQRVQKICQSLMLNGKEVYLIGRKLPLSLFFRPSYPIKRLSLLFNKGSLFYANLNIILFLKLMVSRADVFYANDLDVLPANYLASKLKRVPLVYDSHEYFTEVPELVNRPSIQRIWERIEEWIIPNLQHCITVTPKIAEVYRKKYGVDFKVMRNFPLLSQSEAVEKENYVLYQGALNVGRGLEELIDAMPQVKADLKIIGSGDIEQSLKQQVQQLGLQNKVQFLGKLPSEELKKYTAKAKLGVSLEKKMGLNYTYALPNKVFDYIHAYTPVLYADLIEVKEVLAKYEVGEELESHEADHLSIQINRMLESKNYELWRQNCELAIKELNWQQEEKVLLSIFEDLSA